MLSLLAITYLTSIRDRDITIPISNKSYVSGKWLIILHNYSCTFEFKSDAAKLKTYIVFLPFILFYDVGSELIPHLLAVEASPATISIMSGALNNIIIPVTITKATSHFNWPLRVWIPKTTTPTIAIPLAVLPRNTLTKLQNTVPIGSSLGVVAARASDAVRIRAILQNIKSRRHIRVLSNCSAEYLSFIILPIFKLTSYHEADFIHYSLAIQELI